MPAQKIRAENHSFFDSMFVVHGGLYNDILHASNSYASLRYFLTESLDGERQAVC